MTEALVLCSIPIERKHKTHWHAMAITSDYGTIVLKQCFYCARSNGNLFIVEYHYPYILYWFGDLSLFLETLGQVVTLFHLWQFDYQLTVA